MIDIYAYKGSDFCLVPTTLIHQSTQTELIEMPIKTETIGAGSVDTG